VKWHLVHIYWLLLPRSQTSWRLCYDIILVAKCLLPERQRTTVVDGEEWFNVDQILNHRDLEVTVRCATKHKPAKTTYVATWILHQMAMVHWWSQFLGTCILGCWAWCRQWMNIWLIETYPPFPHKSRESLAHFSLASVHKPMCTHRCSPLSFKIATWRHPAVIIDLTMLSSVMSQPELITRDRKKVAYPRYPPWDHSSSGTHQLVFYICGQG